MWFNYQPGYADSNPWFGFQAWTADRVAQYYYLTGTLTITQPNEPYCILFSLGNTRAEAIITKWAQWVMSEISFDSDEDFTIPSNIKWEELPPNTHVTVTVSVQAFSPVNKL